MPDVEAGGPTYWINTVSLEHVDAAARGGFTQSDHGAATRLRRLRAGDGLVFYSPRTAMLSGTRLQQFTALAEVTGDEPYRVAVSEGFEPWRLAARFEVVHPVDAASLVEQLSFVTDPQHWGLPFRRGLFTVPEADFRLIASRLRESHA